MTKGIKEEQMKTKYQIILGFTVLTLLALPVTAWTQDKDKKADKTKKKQATEEPAVHKEITIGAFYLDDDSYRYGKYSGLKDKGAYALLDFKLEKRPDPKSDDTTRWRFQGWRLGLNSRRVEFDYHQQGTQRFKFNYRKFPNNRFADGLTPFREQTPGNWQLPYPWEISTHNSTTLGFLNLQENLLDLSFDTKRRRLDLAYDRRLSSTWKLEIDFRHETRKGERTLGSIFGFSFANPRGVILPAPVDQTTDTLEALFAYASSGLQFGFGFYASFFSNDEETLVFQNPYNHLTSWAESVSFPDSQGRMALEPDNSYIQFKAYGGANFNSTTRLALAFSYGQMEQDDALLPYSINPDLVVNTPLPVASLDAKIDTLMVNARLTSQLARRLRAAVNYHYDERDNSSSREVYPYIGGDSQDQRNFEDGRINRPYSYSKHKADAILTYRLASAIRMKGGVEYSDYSRDFQEVEDSDELTWLAGISFRGWSKASMKFDFSSSSREVSEYTGNAPLVNSFLAGTIGENDWHNHPLLRKYYLTDRDRDKYRVRADFFPSNEVNFGFAGSYLKDDYDAGFFGLNEATIESWTVDAGWHPQEHITLTGFYTNEKYDASQSSRYIQNTNSPGNPENNWFANTEDSVDTYNIALSFPDIGAERGWRGVEFGMDYTYSNTVSMIDVVSASEDTSPLPDLVSKMQTFSIWGNIAVGDSSSIRLAAENAKLKTKDWGLDGVDPGTLAWVLLLGQNSANYDLWLISASWSYRF
jgi:MtrB/PioB family decaheme-associated outer membrane protein